MTDLKALRREMAEKLAQDLDYGGTPRAIVQAAIESALLQYALACLGEPSHAMVMAAFEYRNSHAEPTVEDTYAAMASQRAKELE